MRGGVTRFVTNCDKGEGESVVLWCHTSRFVMHSTRSHTRKERCRSQYVSIPFTIVFCCNQWGNFGRFAKLYFEGCPFVTDPFVTDQCVRNVSHALPRTGVPETGCALLAGDYSISSKCRSNMCLKFLVAARRQREIMVIIGNAENMKSAEW